MITAEKQKEAILTSLIEDIVELYSSELNALVKHLIANDVFVPVWYPVSTYPPAIDTPVLVSYLAYGTETEVCSDAIACLKADGKWYWWECTPDDSTTVCSVPITHWMPLPKALQPKPAEKHTAYTLPWRNTTVHWVDWENRNISFTIKGMATTIASFANLEYSSNSDVQAIKMIMDRLVVQMYHKELQASGTAKPFVQEYISDVLAVPYEWNTKL